MAKLIKYIYSFIIFIVLPITPSVGQKADVRKTLSFSSNKISLSDFLSVIEDSCLISFSYSHSQLPLDTILIVKYSKKPIYKILKELGKKYSFKYQIVEKQIVLTKNIGPHTLVPYEKLAEESTLYGYIRDKKNGEILIGATVFIDKLKEGTISNSYGFYSLSIPPGKYKVIVSYIGYKQLETEIQLSKNTFGHFQLEQIETKLHEVIIEGHEKMIKKAQSSEITINPSSIGKMPSFMGENDIIKSLNSLPGIKNYGDGSTQLYVRGGNRDQNLILIDEAPIYNPTHLFGFFSIFMSDAVKNINIYKGDIPANYGGRLSSLIDIKTKDGDMKSFHVRGKSGFFTGSLSCEGPIIKDKSSFFVSARKSFFNNFLDFFNYDNLKIGFYDINTKVNYILNKKNRVYAAFYKGNDSYLDQINDTSALGINWSNIAGTLRWNHLFSDKFFSNHTVYASKYDYYLLFAEGFNTYWNSYIGNIAFKSDFTWFPNIKNTIKTGFNVNWHRFNPGNLEIGDEEKTDFFPVVPMNTSREIAFYITNYQKISENLSLRYGFRVPLWQNIGKTDFVKYDNDFNPIDTIRFVNDDVYNSYLNFEPRLSLNYHFASGASVKAAYSRTFQHIQMLSNSISPFTSIEVWYPSSPNIKPQEAQQFIAGYYKNIDKFDVHFSAEIFYKKMLHQIDYKNHASIFLNPLIEGELRFGNSRSYGIETLIKKETGKYIGWVSYTLSRAFSKINDINAGEEFPVLHDRPHDFTFFSALQLNKRWNCSLSWTYASGTAVTLPTGFYNYQGYTVPYYSSRNNARLPDYHRLDVFVKMQLNSQMRKRFKHSVSLAIFNVYNRKNPTSINFNKKINDKGQVVVPANLNENTTIVPTRFYLLGIVPSLNYEFRF